MNLLVRFWFGDICLVLIASCTQLPVGFASGGRNYRSYHGFGRHIDE